jgi:hypothetical protein
LLINRLDKQGFFVSALPFCPVPGFPCVLSWPFCLLPALLFREGFLVFHWPAAQARGVLMSKKLAVTITLNMDVPDHWEVVSTSEGADVLKVGENQFLDLTFEPMVTADIEGEWTNSVTDEFISSLFEMVETEEVAYELAAG